jgi:hypothetical protein
MYASKTLSSYRKQRQQRNLSSQSTKQLLKTETLESFQQLWLLNKNTLKAVYKRLQRKKIEEDEARDKEASQMRTQQACTLSGGVYLRHRLEKQAL